MKCKNCDHELVEHYSSRRLLHKTHYSVICRKNISGTRFVDCECKKPEEKRKWVEDLEKKEQKVMQ